METKMVKIQDTAEIRDEELAEAAQILRDGGLVAFPTETVYGLGADALLAAVIPLFELDAYATPVIMMAPVPGDSLDPAVEAKYRKALNYDGEIEQMERYAFYERAKKAYAVVITGETAKYGNIILKKGVTPLS
jgi:L-fucose mutarotase/ribose pyranase (RbsD/FucU family)